MHVRVFTEPDYTMLTYTQFKMSAQITRKLHFITSFTFDFCKVNSDVYAIFYA